VHREAVPVNLAVAAAVAEARVKASLSQSELAARAGIDQSDISKIERGVANPSITTLGRLVSAMGKELKISIV
jgi:transcriptional regulator with XRE-family HTH domain